MLSSSRYLWLLPALLLGCPHRPASVTSPTAQVVERTPITGPVQAALESGAEDSDIGVRRRALDFLVRYDPSPGGIRYARRALFDPSPYVQAAAVDALVSRLPDPDARAMLIEAAFRREANAYTRGRASLALARLDDELVNNQIRPLWKVAEAGWETAPLALAAAVAGDREAEHALGIVLTSGILPPDLRFFLDVGQSGMASIIPALDKAMAEGGDELGPLVAVALTELHSGTGVEALRKVVLEGDEDRRIDFLEVLALMKSDEATVLIRDSKIGMSPYYKRYADLVLLSRGDLPVRTAKTAYRSHDRDIRAMALTTLSNRFEPSRGLPVTEKDRELARGLCLKGLVDPEETVRIEAVRGLGLTGIPEDRGLLIPFLANEVPITRVEAAGSIQELGGMP